MPRYEYGYYSTNDGMIDLVQEKATDFLWLCLLAFQGQVIFAGNEMSQYCACVSQQKNKFRLVFCDPCLPPDDYRRSSGNNLYMENHGSLVKAVKNSIKRHVRSHFRCSGHNEYFLRFDYGGEVCQMLNTLTGRKKMPDEETTTSAVTDTDGVPSTEPDNTDTFQFESTQDPGVSTSRADDETIVDDKKAKTKDKTNGDRNHDTEGVSAGVVVALCIICFLLGLITMWLIMKFCTKLVLQDIRGQITREDHKPHPEPQNISPNSNIMNTGAYERVSTNQTPEVSKPDSSHRTSYEGLHPENRTDNEYNTLDPAYQTHGQPTATASEPYPAGEYFVLEKENHDDVSDRTNANETKGTPIHTGADYFVLEKENTDTSYSQIEEKRTRVNKGALQPGHDYFVLEKRNAEGSPMNNDTSREKSGSMNNAGPEYFTLEKENIEDNHMS